MSSIPPLFCFRSRHDSICNGRRRLPLTLCGQAKKRGQWSGSPQPHTLPSASGVMGREEYESCFADPMIRVSCRYVCTFGPTPLTLTCRKQSFLGSSQLANLSLSSSTPPNISTISPTKSRPKGILWATCPLLPLYPSSPVCISDSTHKVPMRYPVGDQRISGTPGGMRDRETETRSFCSVPCTTIDVLRDL